MEIKLKGQGFAAISRRLLILERSVSDRGALLMKTAAERTHELALENLASQGRGGSPPPLSGATRRIYERDGQPDGSGIRNHMEVSYQRNGNETVAILGILAGQPSVVARVQDQGATIAVTEAMRGFLSARYGINLRATTTYIHVPGRRFWERAVLQSRRELIQELRSFFKDL